MRVVFRVDSSAKIGGGHLMRCLTLAEELQDNGVQVSFVCRNLPGSLISLIKKRDITVSILPAADINLTHTSTSYGAWLGGVSQVQDSIETIGLLGGIQPDWLVVDHYALDERWERVVRGSCKNLMVIDDLADRQHDCDVLLDQNYSQEDGQRYEALVPLTCNMLIGSNYALLRKEFRELRQLKVFGSNKLNNILVFFTSGNDQGETLKAMQGIVLFGKAVRVDVVIGDANPDKNIIKEICAVRKWGYHCQIDYMPKLIFDADLVIGGAGSSSWERCALGVPALVVVLAQNQVDISQALDRAGAAIELGWNTDLQPSDYANAIRAITPEQLKSLSERSSRLVDAGGAQRVVKVLLDK